MSTHTGVLLPFTRDEKQDCINKAAVLRDIHRPSISLWASLTRNLQGHKHDILSMIFTFPTPCSHLHLAPDDSSMSSNMVVHKHPLRSILAPAMRSQVWYKNMVKGPKLEATNQTAQHL
jgi:hypothetical protein